MYWTKQRGKVEFGQPQSESELKPEHNRVVGTQCTGGFHIYRAVLQVVIQLLKINCYRSGVWDVWWHRKQVRGSHLACQDV